LFSQGKNNRLAIQKIRGFLLQYLYGGVIFIGGMDMQVVSGAKMEPLGNMFSRPPV
jgi:hypothetical protein